MSYRTAREGAEDVKMQKDEDAQSYKYVDSHCRASTVQEYMHNAQCTTIRPSIMRSKIYPDAI